VPHLPPCVSRTQPKYTAAVTSSNAQPAVEQPHRISAIPAMVTGTIPTAHARARCARVIAHRRDVRKMDRGDKQTRKMRVLDSLKQPSKIVPSLVDRAVPVLVAPTRSAKLAMRTALRYLAAISALAGPARNTASNDFHEA
jgi:hypothetical protein